MKINNKKIIVSTLALAMGAALAGSISGSVAWYQYSTRATASLSGASAGSSRNLQIKSNKAGAQWGWDVSADEIKGITGNHANGDLKPIGAVIDANNDITSMTSHPLRQYGFSAADRSDYLQFSLSFKSTKEGGALEAIPVYLETLDITFANADLAEALRISVDDGTNNPVLLSKTAVTTTTHGNLDLNGDGCPDRNILEGDDNIGVAKDGETWKFVESEKPADGAVPANRFEDKKCEHAASGTIGDTGAGATYASGTTFYYFGDAVATDGAPVANSKVFDKKIIDYKSDTSGGSNQYTTEAWAGKVATFSADGYTATGTALGSTTTDAENPLTLTFTIWIEGWAKIGSPTASNIWNSSLVGTAYSIQMRFQTEAQK